MKPYRVFNMSSGADEERIEVHVFARAYRGAWRAICGVEPSGRHEVAALDLAMDFGEPTPARIGSSNAGAAAVAGRTGANYDGVDVPPGGRHDH